MARSRKPKGKPLPKCATCGSTDIGWCSVEGGWWCANGHNAEDPATWPRANRPRKERGPLR